MNQRSPAYMARVLIQTTGSMSALCDNVSAHYVTGIIFSESAIDLSTLCLAIFVRFTYTYAPRHNALRSIALCRIHLGNAVVGIVVQTAKGNFRCSLLLDVTICFIKPPPFITCSLVYLYVQYSMFANYD